MRGYLPVTQSSELGNDLAIVQTSYLADWQHEITREPHSMLTVSREIANNFETVYLCLLGADKRQTDRQREGEREGEREGRERDRQTDRQRGGER